MAEVFSLIKHQQSPILTTVERNGTSAASASGQDKIPTSAERISISEVFKALKPQYTLPPLSSETIVQSLIIYTAYTDTGKLNQFIKPTTVAPYPFKRFIPIPNGLFGRTRTPTPATARRLCCFGTARTYMKRHCSLSQDC